MFSRVPFPFAFPPAILESSAYSHSCYCQLFLFDLFNRCIILFHSFNLLSMMINDAEHLSASLPFLCLLEVPVQIYCIFFNIEFFLNKFLKKHITKLCIVMYIREKQWLKTTII